MPHYICTNCGTQFAKTDQPPQECTICKEEREFVAWGGQNWTTADKLAQSHRNVIRMEENGLYGIGMEPSFAIGQRGLLITHSEGNVLWDCISLLDNSLVEMLKGIGGVSAIAISHPHYYTCMIEWAETFDCPVFLHHADRKWVMRSGPAIEFWEGDTKSIGSGLTLIRCGGHFEGGTVLHWPEGACGKGALLSGDIIHVVQDRRWVSFMYSYPNLIPLSPAKVRQIVDSVAPFEYDRIYGAWWGKTVANNARAAVDRSAERYIQHLQE
ncbi:MBL fold metallo-hydrolase [Gimesia sp.]|uniref:MBL fold metallo-hydrolase n=1 Tax=Gimesia sp. TaxID=2024833 RepID=UPI000C3B2980|nr:MBL fold metallo-hydrolase [Gimesia sp.]MAX38240.1 MBL fold metallo-hydrolase [Gimesia sp.]HAH43727.1 MBL fold metallo-hydrolase [Planctomycetaceae bacterium]HBL43684.1 MBL fold metallo-hydrolase [Planctomycetaceae bacterium]|tara:strand:- start:959 stop:1765 length:807 start_codon:yes stop_codon:yes gene_type:complete